MNNKKNTEIMEALDKSRKAMPSDAFLTKMEELAVAYSNKISSFSKQTMFGIAASFLLLVVGNVYVVNQSQAPVENQIEEPAAENYTLVPTKLLYDE